jgi:hypothetical protein
MRVLPFREPDSRAALANFVAAMQRLDLSIVDLDAVLLRVLAIIDASTERRMPSLVDRYLAGAVLLEDPIGRLVSCLANRESPYTGC